MLTLSGWNGRDDSVCVYTVRASVNFILLLIPYAQLSLAELKYDFARETRVIVNLHRVDVAAV